jgi:hypothetical protein
MNLLFSVIMLTGHVSYTHDFRLTPCHDIYTLLGFYAAKIGSLLPLFQDKPSVPSSRVKAAWPLKMGLTGVLKLW